MSESLNKKQQVLYAPVDDAVVQRAVDNDNGVYSQIEMDCSINGLLFFERCEDGTWNLTKKNLSQDYKYPKENQEFLVMDLRAENEQFFIAVFYLEQLHIIAPGFEKKRSLNINPRALFFSVTNRRLYLEYGNAIYSMEV